MAWSLGRLIRFELGGHFGRMERLDKTRWIAGRWIVLRRKSLILELIWVYLAIALEMIPGPAALPQYSTVQKTNRTKWCETR